MNCRIEIEGDKVTATAEGLGSVDLPLDRLWPAVARAIGYEALPEALPEGIRFVERRGDGVVLVIEEKPRVRTVTWLDDASPAQKGPEAVYRSVRLAFPFVIVVLGFERGMMTHNQQCFFRTAPLERLSDPLLHSCLYNVADKHGIRCQLCLEHVDVTDLPWPRKADAIMRYFWGSAWNQSYELGGVKSYWQRRPGDTRLASVSRWEQESLIDPFFPLQVVWQPADITVGEAISGILDRVAPGRAPGNASQLYALLARENKIHSRRLRWIERLAGGR